MSIPLLRWLPATTCRRTIAAGASAQSVSLRHGCPRPVYVRRVRNGKKVLLICGDITADPFAHARQHAEGVPPWNAVPGPLPHRCPGSYAESTNQPRNQTRSDVAKQSVLLAYGAADFELAALRGGITRAQP